ncbi:hypothetical protein KIN20_026486 [Parelaphostrongylus tenuis]|uniref:Uncharacterized protein n=1 Tax=Parelaphostrongylus tenuis TaxID=148309 RepID=A0AAD5QY23_PARTN|nr:hypothetical protein KIN20_026486 [Parelaphostrongylus tenuis]
MLKFERGLEKYSKRIYGRPNATVDSGQHRVDRSLDSRRDRPWRCNTLSSQCYKEQARLPLTTESGFSKTSDVVDQFCSTSRDPSTENGDGPVSLYTVPSPHAPPSLLQCRA